MEVQHLWQLYDCFFPRERNTTRNSTFKSLEILFAHSHSFCASFDSASNFQAMGVSFFIHQPPPFCPSCLYVQLIHSLCSVAPFHFAQLTLLHCPALLLLLFVTENHYLVCALLCWCWLHESVLSKISTCNLAGEDARSWCFRGRLQELYCSSVMLASSKRSSKWFPCRIVLFPSSGVCSSLESGRGPDLASVFSGRIGKELSRLISKGVDLNDAGAFEGRAYGWGCKSHIAHSKRRRSLNDQMWYRRYKHRHQPSANDSAWKVGILVRLMVVVYESRVGQAERYNGMGESVVNEILREMR